MKTPQEAAPLAAQTEKNSYTVNSFEDEIRVDRLCTALLKKFHRALLDEQQLDPLTAGSLAAGADFFLRDFVVDNRRMNLFDVTSAQVRAFAGHWYITSNLEPNLAELTSLLKGVESFYLYCAANQLIEQQTAGEISDVCNDLSYYGQRIESFLDLTGDGFFSWKKECPLT